MAKRKKKASAPAPRRRGSSQRTTQLVTLIVMATAYVFVLFSVFNAAGSLGKFLHDAMRYTLGEATPVYAGLLIWLVLRRYFPKYVTPPLAVTLNLAVILLAVTGVMHSFVKGDLLEAVRLGQGGGIVGYTTYSILLNGFGPFMGKLLLFVLLFTSLIVLLNQVVPLVPAEEAEGEEDEHADLPEGKVRVMGEIRGSGGGLSRLKNPLAKRREAHAPVVQLPVQKQPLPYRRVNNWVYPPVTILDKLGMKPMVGNIKKNMDNIRKTLEDFGIAVNMTEVNVGPTVSQYTLKPADGVKLNQITARQNDMALALAAQSLRVEAPIPGKGLVGVEIPNEKKAMIALRDVLEHKQFEKSSSKLSLVLGLGVAGEPVVADLDRMPHLLIAGATGSGKSVCINSVIVNLLLNNSPDELRMILVDPKRVELTGYNGLPHLLTPVITEPKDTVKALAWCVEEMERRYKLFANTGKRNIEQYNQAPDLGTGPLPYLVVIVDELADLMMVAAREVEGSIVRLAQMARAVGIHLIIATQRPSVNVITGLIKANIPTRIAFAVASQIDSRTILDMAGAEKLLGQGDMLYISTEFSKPKRVQGVFVSEHDINSVIGHIKLQEAGDRYDPAVMEARVESRLGNGRGGDGGGRDDDLCDEAYELFKQAGKASTTMLQSRLGIGYARANRIVDILEERGQIGPSRGAKPREVYGVAYAESDMEEDSLAE
jgi:DNA segregation ATPase FtsK/SpoIIIE-like protein